RRCHERDAGDRVKDADHGPDGTADDPGQGHAAVVGLTRVDLLEAEYAQHDGDRAADHAEEGQAETEDDGRDPGDHPGQAEAVLLALIRHAARGWRRGGLEALRVVLLRRSTWLHGSPCVSTSRAVGPPGQPGQLLEVRSLIVPHLRYRR